MARTSARGRENLVRQHRRALDLTQARLADQVGVARQTIVALESGDYAPSVYLALGLAEALGATVEQLFGACGGDVDDGTVQDGTVQDGDVDVNGSVTDGDGEPSRASTNGSVR